MGSGTNPLSQTQNHSQIKYMISRHSVPFAGGPVLLKGTSLSDIQKLLLSGYKANELSVLLGEKTFSFPTSWVCVGGKDQLTALSAQEDQGRLIMLLSGSAYVISIAIKKSVHDEPVIFRIAAGNSEAVWVPSGFAQGFFFLSQNTIALTAATKKRNLKKTAYYDPGLEKFKIDLSALTGTRARIELANLVLLNDS